MTVIAGWWVVVAALVLSTWFSAGASEPVVTEIEFSQPGIYTVSPNRTRNAPGTALGYINVVSNPKLVKQTLEIPACMGMTFGVWFKAKGPRPRVVPAQAMTRFPKPGLRKPGHAQAIEVSRYRVELQVWQLQYRSYTFERDWELVPGRWSFEFWHQGRKLGEQSFNVVRPATCCPDKRDCLS